jgi:tetratricopeptide (TPR) repeat protein
LTGDLDNLVLMALRKDPERRYQSVEQFSEDIRRYLSGLPVVARKDTFSYRAGKFARRHKAGVTMIGLLIGFAVVLSVLTVRLARERDRAERRFTQVRKLSNTFLFDFHDKIQNIPGTTETRAMVAKTALEYLDSLAQEAANDPQIEWELAVAYQKVGDVQGDPWSPNLGLSQEAMQSYQKGLKLAQRLTQNGANDLKMLRLLAQGYFKLGALQAQSGEKSAAHEALTRALAAAEILERQTHDLEDLRLLQNCNIRLGDTYLDTGDPVNALESYRREMRISERRMTEFPGDRSQYTLSMSHTRVPEALISLGDLPGALDHYRKSLEIIDELLTWNPANPLYLRARMISLVWLGNLTGNPRHINLGDTRGALNYYYKCLEIAEQLVQIDPKNARARQDLAGKHRLVAEILTLENPAQAVDHYRQALSIVREMLKSAPNDAQLMRWEAQFLKGQAETLQRLGDRQTAQQNLRQSLGIWELLVKRDSANQKTQGDMHTTLLALADSRLESGDHTEALELYQRALKIAENPPVEQSADVYVRWRLADSYSGLSRYHSSLAATTPADERQSHWREARQYSEKSLRLWEGWSLKAKSSSFDQLRRDQAARAVEACDVALAKTSDKIARNSVKGKR